MRKIAPIFLLIAILCVGCKQEKPVIEHIVQDDIILVSKEHLETINIAVENSLDIYENTLYVEGKEGLIDIKVYMKGGMSKWIFADCVYKATSSARNAISDCGEALGKLSVVFIVESPNDDNAFKWESDDYDTGLLVDTEARFTKEISLEQMMERYSYEPID